MVHGIRTGVAAVVVLLLFAAVPRAVQAQRCMGGRALCLLPFDIGQGPVLGTDGVVTPYTLSFRLSPTLGLGRVGTFRFGPSAALTYVSSSWELAGGARAALRLAGYQKFGLFLTVDALRGSGGRAPVAGALVVDLGVVRAGFWAVRDLKRDVTSLEFSLGTGLESLLPVLFPPGSQEPDFRDGS